MFFAMPLSLCFAKIYRPKTLTEWDTVFTAALAWPFTCIVWLTAWALLKIFGKSKT